jgi:hypothetical protein
MKVLKSESPVLERISDPSATHEPEQRRSSGLRDR